MRYSVRFREGTTWLASGVYKPPSIIVFEKEEGMNSYLKEVDQSTLIDVYVYIKRAVTIFYGTVHEFFELQENQMVRTPIKREDDCREVEDLFGEIKKGAQ